MAETDARYEGALKIWQTRQLVRCAGILAFFEALVAAGTALLLASFLPTSGPVDGPLLIAGGVLLAGGIFITVPLGIYAFFVASGLGAEAPRGSRWMGFTASLGGFLVLGFFFDGLVLWCARARRASSARNASFE